MANNSKTEFHIHTIRNQGHYGKRKFLQENSISEWFKGIFTCFLQVQSLKLYPLLPINPKLINHHINPFIYRQISIQTATTSIFRQINSIFLFLCRDHKQFWRFNWCCHIGIPNSNEPCMYSIGFLAQCDEEEQLMFL